LIVKVWLVLSFYDPARHGAAGKQDKYRYRNGQSWEQKKPRHVPTLQRKAAAVVDLDQSACVSAPSVAPEALGQIGRRELVHEVSKRQQFVEALGHVAVSQPWRQGVT
jgi:hypothetical protein